MAIIVVTLHCSDTIFLSGAKNVNCDTGENILPIDIATFVIEILIVVDHGPHGVRRGANQHTHDDYTMRLFDALLTSKNAVFRSMVQSKKDDWELGGKVNNSKLIDECVTKYNNMKKQNLWNHSNSTNAKIIALTTNIENSRKRLHLLLRQKARQERLRQLPFGRRGLEEINP